MSQAAIRKLLIGFLAIVIPGSANAQSSRPVTATPVSKSSDADSKAKRLEAERILRQRQEQAQALLIALAADANTFSDQTVRARTQARIGDMLWDLDSERARALFRKAWEAAELADAEGQKRLAEDIRRQQEKTGSGGYAVASPPEIRTEVLRLAAKRDRALGEELLGKLREQKDRQATDAGNSRHAEDQSVTHRLSLAEELLAAGDIERAMQFAQPFLRTVSMQTVDFLVQLREKDPALGDATYRGMLAAATTDPRSDANTVSLLSSYIFSPHLYISFAGGGTSSSQTSGNIAPISVPAEVLAAFFRTAASILMRPLPPMPEQVAPAVTSEFLVLRRLLPLFDQYASPEIAQAIHSQFDAVSAMAGERLRQREDDWSRRGNGPGKSAADGEQALLDQIDHAKTSAERDSLYFQLANSAASRGDLHARDYTDKIDDTEMRHAVRAFVDITLVRFAVNKKDRTTVVDLTRSGELTHLQKAWAFSQAARFAAKSDKEAALGLVDEAMTEARRMETSDPDRPRAFLAAVNALLAVDRARGWDAMGDAIQAANSAEGFAGEDGQLTFGLSTKGYSAISQYPTSEFDLAPAFDMLAREDFSRAVELARGFEREAPRANAVIAIARSVLSEKPKVAG